ncbi:endonuclease domain-containing protein [Wenzhouxiangella sp. AB-CW3]|uniref:endonuclease domain-containing protein n=1 Tax=Wenzhouxiangella sp. AB-CW3 TaxID=2771012 RepID=UPI00168AA38A|nr:endonuclease domain-containing protein [Wenzhouxiangella sp. AB-CW3]QOC23593.1 endonuclease domain-containing protein [Wenzhouxiangella sp. AB-CW3]
MPKPAAEPASIQAGLDWSRQASVEFCFVSRALDVETGWLRLDYRLDHLELTERFRFPGVPFRLDPPRIRALEQALDLLHWSAGISYWKAGCPSRLTFAGRRPDAWQSAWLSRLWREGLAEFAWQNDLDVTDFPAFPGRQAEVSEPPCLNDGARTLLPMGGGKDSLVALERLRSAGTDPVTVQVGQAALIGEVADCAGTDHRVIERRIDPQLGELNRRGAWNGHVPITAINGAALLVFAVLAGFGRVVFANERSADEQTLTDAKGRAVNHQFSKSYSFERMLSDWIGRYVASDTAVFSLLRRDRELAICRDFAKLDSYHAHFSSCNRNFHLDGARTRRWCGTCPKCHFVFLALAPFMAPDALVGIFGRDLLNDPEQVDGFRQLLALDGAKPFECVGEAVEARVALASLGEPSSMWSSHAVVRQLLPELPPEPLPALTQLCRPDGPHQIPDDLLADA